MSPAPRPQSPSRPPDDPRDDQSEARGWLVLAVVVLLLTLLQRVL